MASEIHELADEKWDEFWTNLWKLRKVNALEALRIEIFADRLNDIVNQSSHVLIVDVIGNRLKHIGTIWNEIDIYQASILGNDDYTKNVKDAINLSIDLLRDVIRHYLSNRFVLLN